MKRLTSSVYSFENLIQDGFLYVDKTEYVWKLVEVPRESYFLSRPRRFGKSLTLSTLKAVFEGKRELFRGLALYDKPYDWKPYPVIHLSMGDYNAMSDALRELPQYLMGKIQTIARAKSISLSAGTPTLCFGELIDTLARKRSEEHTSELQSPS